MEVKFILDYVDYPILTIEKEKNNVFLSYLNDFITNNDGNIIQEERIYIPINENNIFQIWYNDIKITNLFKEKIDNAFIILYDYLTGEEIRRIYDNIILKMDDKYDIDISLLKNILNNNIKPLLHIFSL